MGLRSEEKGSDRGDVFEVAGSRGSAAALGDEGVDGDRKQREGHRLSASNVRWTGNEGADRQSQRRHSLQDGQEGEEEDRHFRAGKTHLLLICGRGRVLLVDEGLQRMRGEEGPRAREATRREREHAWGAK